MNSVANGKVRRRTRFQRVYVQAAAGDAGGAIGSALAHTTSSVVSDRFSWITPIGGRNSAKRKSPA